ncbi:MAG TPA: hypothetical protein VFU50_21500 [Terriglobales bacterium]|nr:hypothetical protein [Terriglobales bacterium]
MKKVAFSFLIVVLTLIHAKSVAQQAPAPGENAALQYYSAFLQMKDAEISDADVQELSEIIAGTKNYNEAKFGTLVDNNTEALRTMWAGAVLPTCDWGLGYLSAKLGWQTPVPYFWRSRVLGRLDVLYALRQWDKGNRDDAVAALSSGLKFARDVSSGGPLVPILIAKALLAQQLSVANRFADSGKLTFAQKRLLRATLDELGSDGLNWPAAADVEMKTVKRNLDLMRSAPDQSRYYAKMMGNDPPEKFHGVTSADYAAVEKIRSAFLDMFHDDNADSVQQQIDAAPDVVRIMIPNPAKVLQSSRELKQALDNTRAKLM